MTAGTGQNEVYADHIPLPFPQAQAVDRALAGRGNVCTLAVVALHVPVVVALAGREGGALSAAAMTLGALVVFAAAAHLAPWALWTRCLGGVTLQVAVALLARHTGGVEAHLLYYTTILTLLAYQDWRVFWPAALIALTTGLGLDLATTAPAVSGDAVGMRPDRVALHLGATIVHTGMASAWASILRVRSIRSAALAYELEARRQEVVLERETAREAEAAKSRFLASISHELRTPLTAVAGYAQLLDLGLAGSITAEQRAYLARIATNATRLTATLDEILTVADATPGRDVPRVEALELGTVVREVVGVMRPMATARGLTLTLDIPPAGCVVWSDAHKMRHILSNLISNAIKFTQRGTVAVTAERRQGPAGTLVHLQVQDTGIGIPVEQQGRIFDPFWRAPHAREHGIGGVGIGLSVVHHHVSQLHGEVTVTSVAGSGTTVTVILPSRRALSTRASTAGFRGAHPDGERSTSPTGVATPSRPHLVQHVSQQCCA